MFSVIFEVLPGDGKKDSYLDPAKDLMPIIEKIDGVEHLRHRLVRVVRDYGKFDRREAPQFYPDAEGAPTRHPEPAH